MGSCWHGEQYSGLVRWCPTRTAIGQIGHPLSRLCYPGLVNPAEAGPPRYHPTNEDLFVGTPLHHGDVTAS